MHVCVSGGKIILRTYRMKDPLCSGKKLVYWLIQIAVPNVVIFHVGTCWIPQKPKVNILTSKTISFSIISLLISGSIRYYRTKSYH